MLRAEMEQILTGDIPSDRAYITKHGTESVMATDRINAGRQESLLSPHVALPLKSQDDVDREEITAFRDEFASNDVSHRFHAGAAAVSVYASLRSAYPCDAFRATAIVRCSISDATTVIVARIVSAPASRCASHRMKPSMIS